MPSVTVPETGSGPQATLSLITVVSPGAGATKPGDRYTATGRLPTGAGPLPCSQYLVNTGCAGSGAGCAAGTLGWAASRTEARSAGSTASVTAERGGTMTVTDPAP